MPNFISLADSIGELARGEKSHTRSPSLFDAPGTEALTLLNIIYVNVLVHQ